MSVMGDKNLEKRNKGKANTRFEALQKRNGSGEVDLSGLASEQVSNTIIAVVRGGGAIMFGVTSDGGALCLTLLDGGERHKEYLHTADEILYALEAIRVIYDGA